MFERFTDGARRVVVLAQEHAREARNNSIYPVHLLRGMLHIEDAGTAVLTKANVSTEMVDALIAQLETVPSGNISGHIPFHPSATSALERGLREALNLGDNYISPLHLLL